ncbi:MAG: hypothetical protein D6785_12610 [Planctomycetota bacterium]|nr:MAG: hypothetical protein D6785_12610 [Planctomycetota bacterium]
MSGKEFFGSLVVKKGYASPQDILDCLKIQRRARQFSKKSLPLGEIMVFKGILSPSQLQEILQEVGEESEVYRSEDTMLFSELLLEKGFLTSEQILDGLDTQWKESLEGKGFRPLGEILKDKGYLTEEQYKEALDLYEKSGILTVIALKDNIRFKTDALDAPREVTIPKGVTYYTFPEKFKTGTYRITWYVQQEGFKGPYLSEFLLKGNTAIAPIVDSDGNGRVLYFQIS